MILNLTLRQREIHLNDVKRELRSGVGMRVSKPCIRMWDLDRESQSQTPPLALGQRTLPTTTYPIPVLTLVPCNAFISEPPVV